MSRSVSIFGEISPNGRNLTSKIWRKWAELRKLVGDLGEIEEKVGDLGENCLKLSANTGVT